MSDKGKEKIRRIHKIGWDQFSNIYTSLTACMSCNYKDGYSDI